MPTIIDRDRKPDVVAQVCNPNYLRGGVWSQPSQTLSLKQIWG
jgi:hypothetical protein